MTLSPNQLAALRTDLITLVQLDYAHLRDELLDHYATLTEEHMTRGVSFYEAHTAAWQELGGERGIQHIQTRYERVTRLQLRNRHRAIVKRLVQWPALLSTLLMLALLAYLMVVLPLGPLRILIVGLATLPALVVLAAAISYYYTKDSRKKLAWAYLRKAGHLPYIALSLLQLFSITGHHAPSRFVMGTLAVVALISWFRALTLAQLMREHFSFKLT